MNLTDTQHLFYVLYNKLLSLLTKTVRTYLPRLELIEDFSKNLIHHFILLGIHKILWLYILL